MKHRVTIYLTFAALMLTALGVLWFVTEGKAETKRDMVAYNDALHKIGEAYLKGTAKEEIEREYGCRLMLTSDPDGATLGKMYAEYGLVLDFAPEGEVIGKVGWNDASSEFSNREKTLRKSLLWFWAAVCAGGLIFLLVIDRLLLRPTRELRAYAGEIAKGNLDVPLPIRKHNPFGNLTEAFDIMREELRASKEREAEAEKAKKELVAELAHDIKTPVATIQATCEVLALKAKRRMDALETADEDRASGLNDARDVMEKAQTITAKTETIRQLMDNVFQTTLEELDHITVTRAEESSETIEEYFKNLKNYGTIILENAIPSCLVYMDRLRMEQVIDNVVGNSHKYAGTDVRVRFDEVRMKTAERDETVYIRIRIRDEGPGVPEEELPMLTQKYYRGAAAKGKTGFGLGLYLVKTYMEKQGGGAEIYNDNGFTVDLYLRKV